MVRVGTLIPYIPTSRLTDLLCWLNEEHDRPDKVRYAPHSSTTRQGQ
jgi:hypothetical protein